MGALWERYGLSRERCGNVMGTLWERYGSVMVCYGCHKNVMGTLWFLFLHQTQNLDFSMSSRFEVD